MRALCDCALLSQGCDEVLQRLSVLQLQQGVLPAEEGEVCEERVEVGVQAQHQHLFVVRPVNVSQSPEKQQKHLLHKEDEACRKHRTCERRER